MATSQEELQGAMYELVKSSHGKRDLKPMDVTKAMIERFGDENVSKSDCKQALRQLMDSGKLTYKYAGGSFVALPEGS